MSFLNGQRVLVTGGAGFLGKAVCQALRDYSPHSIDVPRSRDFDLRWPADVRRVLKQFRPDVVIHLAAVVGGIGANRRNPGRYFYDNAVMGIHMMEESRLAGVGKFVAVGTICSYPKETPVPFQETQLWNGYPEETNAPYGLAKKMLLVQAQAYRQQYDFNAVTLLPVNLYGPGDNFHPETSHVIPALIRKAVRARDNREPRLEVWGTGRASREFLFVRDAARAIALAAEHYNKSEPVNIGSGQEITIGNLAALICDLCAFRGELAWDAGKPDGQPRRCLDTTRAREEFGFEAATSLRDGLIETISWYERNLAALDSKDAPAPASGNGKPVAQPRVSPATRNRAAHDRGRHGFDAVARAASHSPHADAARNGDGRRAFITGINGQDGSYLAELLLSKGYEVHGLIRRSSSINTARLDRIYQDPHRADRRLVLHYGDITDSDRLTRLVLEIEPDEIYNLAAQSHVRVSFDVPINTAEVVAIGAMRLLEAARCLQKQKEVRLYQASSSEMYGDVVETPQTETTPFRPRSPYACAKVFAYYQTVNYRQAYELFACNGILFNHESPRRGETFVSRKITRAVGRIKEGLQNKLYLGNLQARRDWGHAQEYVDAMWRMLQQDVPDDFVIATGDCHTVEEFVNLAFRHLDMDWQDYVEFDPRYLRPTEVNSLTGDASKARELLGWEPTVTFESLVQEMVEADWELARQEAAGSPSSALPAHVG